MRELVRLTLLLVLGGFFGFPALRAAPFPDGRAFQVIDDQTLPAKKLRGYGSLAGHFTEFISPAGSMASCLTIQSPSTNLAAMVLAKYNSDLRALGDITESNLVIGTRIFPLAVTRHQGAIAAFRQMATVTVVAADAPADLSKLLASFPAANAGGLDFTGGQVPVYLDTFDQHGFGFYYFGWEASRGQPESYDYRKDFEFAKKYHVTLHFQADPNRSDTAEGVVDWPRFEANVDLARQLGIPANIGTWGKAGPDWLMNRYPDQMQLMMPDYVGRLAGPGYDAKSFGPAVPAWSSRAAENTLLSLFPPVIRKYSTYENVTEFMDPHEEIEHNTPAVMTDYGPAADAVYQDFLKHKYPTIEAVRQRWSAPVSAFKKWSDIRIPEVAGFLGWGPDAIDLKGVWQIQKDAALLPADFSRWSAPGLDDSSWNQLMAPGDDRAIFQPLAGAPGVFRRRFFLPSAELARLKSAGDGKIYIYVWDMEYMIHKTVEVALNGSPAGHFENPTYTSSWCAFEVSSNLQAGTNLVALHLPCGELSYKIYLSPHAPRCYPDLGPGENARWVDFRDFVTWTRQDSVRRAMEMIRREDANRFIRLPAPDQEVDVEKALAEDFGGQFHDTGGMSGNWEDSLPALMHSSGLPFTLEPGSGASGPDDLKVYFGRWLTEGVNGVDYIYNMRRIQEDPAMLTWFDTHQPLVHIIGKYHTPGTSVAVLNGEESVHLTGFPWDKFSNDLTGNHRPGPLGVINEVPAPRDLILDSDFARGNAAQYHLIIDDNTLIMDEPLLAGIEQWVRAGGIFITAGHSGRHSPLAANTWPISRLTGYQVTGIADHSTYRAAPGQTVLTDPVWNSKDAKGNGYSVAGKPGLFLQKTAPECRDVLVWGHDRGTALGVRPLGRGFVITDAFCLNYATFLNLLRWCGCHPPVQAADSCRVSRFASNNGLNDVLVVWGEKLKSDATVNLSVENCPDHSILDISSGQTLTGVPVNGTLVFSNLAMNPLETRVFLVPRHKIAAAPLAWLALQRDWWQGTRPPAPVAPPAPKYPNSLDLTPQCAFSPIPENAADLSPWVATTVDDRAWPRLNLGIWSVASPETKRGVFRRELDVPENWRTGHTWLWLNGWDAVALRPPFRAEIFLDGKSLWTTNDQKYASLTTEISNRLPPGRHILAFVTSGNTTMNGFLGNAWLEHLPEPGLRQSLAGHWGPGIDLPGTAPLMGAKKNFVPLAAGQGKTVMLYADGGVLVSKIFINGHWLNRSLGLVRGEHFRMNLTPFIRWNAENEIELCPLYSNPTNVKTIEIRYYDPKAL